MSKPVKSQWDFGELFPSEATRKVLTVSELTVQVKRLLEKQVGQVWITGEVTNFRAQSSGHFYFTLKDADSQLSCVLFRNEALESRALLQDGRKVVLQGDLTVYEVRGQYQLRVTAVELQGVGGLQLAFEKLKQKLNAEGLFALERKRLLPRCPQRIGLVTSPTGAAIRDVLHVIRRRHSGLEIILAPCRVQGQGAAGEIVAAIRLLNEFSTLNVAAAGRSDTLSPQRGEGRGLSSVAFPSTVALAKVEAKEDEGLARHSRDGLDLILLTRGGGSLEDLWAFNEEVVARAIFESALPVVSAVGHEIDFTISDFVADLRAATPSAAAELITEGAFSCGKFLSALGPRLRQLCRQQLEDKEYEAEQLLERLARAHPQRRLDAWVQRLDELQSALGRCARHGVRVRQLAGRGARERLLRLRPRQLLAQRRELTQRAARRLREQMVHQLRNSRHRLKTLESRLRLLGPEQVLARGYSITMDAASGAIIRAAEEVKSGQELKTRLQRGEVKSVVKR